MSLSAAPPARPRILVVAPSAYPFGGVANWLDGLVAGLRERAWPVEVALLSGHHHDVDRYLAQHPLGTVRRVACSSGSPVGRQRALSHAIADSRVDAVLAVNVGDIEPSLDRLRRSRGVAPRLVSTQHAFQADFYAHLAVHASVLDGVVVTNRLGIELVNRFAKLPPDRIAYAPYGVDFAEAPIPRGSSDALRIVWAGRLAQRQKRVGDLPRICAALDRLGVNYRLDVAGRGPDEESLRAGLAPFESVGKIRWLGEVSNERLRREIFGSGDVLLITSDWETGPIVAWEALAAGLAVVSARYVGVGREEALRHDETALIFPVGDADAAAAALNKAHDEAIRRRLVAAGQQEVAARYSRSASLDQWEAALLRVTSLPPRDTPYPRHAAPAAGRLDRWLGRELAESVRRAAGVNRRQASPGAEWPHALLPPGDQDAFLRQAAELDRSRASDGAVR